MRKSVSAIVVALISVVMALLCVSTAGAQSAQTITVGQTVNGALTSSSPTNDAGPFEMYQFDLKEDQLVRIMAISKDFTPSCKVTLADK
jgi:hypothetical protein